MKDEERIFAERVKKLLDARGISQRELAEMSGITNVTISRYINKSRIPTADNVAKIAGALGVTCDYLLGLSNNPHMTRNTLPSVQPERLTDDDFETIRIHLNACKEKLCIQQRWKEAEEYQRIIDRFMTFASAHPDVPDTNAGDMISRQAPEVDRWIPVTKDMPEEKDAMFAKFWGTDKWNKFMYRRKSELVEVTVELEDGTRYTEASRTRDGKWDVEEIHGAVKKKVVAWHYMSEPWEGRVFDGIGSYTKDGLPLWEEKEGTK